MTTDQGGIPPDPEGKAQELLAEPQAPKKRGRPKGSGRRAPAPEPEPVDVGPPTEAEIQAMGTLGGIVWALVAVRLARLTPLDTIETRQLGTAMVPVFRKYANLLGGFEAEFTLLVTVGGLALAHLPPREPEGMSPEEARTLGLNP